MYKKIVLNILISAIIVTGTAMRLDKVSVFIIDEYRAENGYTYCLSDEKGVYILDENGEVSFSKRLKARHDGIYYDYREIVADRYGNFYILADLMDEERKITGQQLQKYNKKGRQLEPVYEDQISYRPTIVASNNLSILSEYLFLNIFEDQKSVTIFTIDTARLTLESRSYNFAKILNSEVTVSEVASDPRVIYVKLEDGQLYTVDVSIDNDELKVNVIDPYAIGMSPYKLEIDENGVLIFTDIFHLRSVSYNPTDGKMDSKDLNQKNTVIRVKPNLQRYAIQSVILFICTFCISAVIWFVWSRYVRRHLTLRQTSTVFVLFVSLTYAIFLLEKRVVNDNRMQLEKEKLTAVVNVAAENINEKHILDADYMSLDKYDMKYSIYAFDSLGRAYVIKSNVYPIGKQDEYRIPLGCDMIAERSFVSLGDKGRGVFEINAFVYEAETRIYLYIVALMSGAAVILILALWPLLRGFGKISAGLEQMEADNWKVLVDIKTDDAMGDLANELNRMSNRLQKHVSSLVQLSRAYKKFAAEDCIKLLDKESIFEINTGDSAVKMMTMLTIRLDGLNDSAEPYERFGKLNRILAVAAKNIRTDNGIIENFGFGMIRAFFAGSTDSAIDAALKTIEETELPITATVQYGEVLFGIAGDEQRYRLISISQMEGIDKEVARLLHDLQSRLMVTEHALENTINRDKYIYRFTGYVKTEDGRVKLYDFLDAYDNFEKMRKIKTLPYFEDGAAKLGEGLDTEARKRFIDVLKVDGSDKAAKAYILKLSGGRD